MTNVGHIMGPLNRWALSKPLPIRRDIHFPEHFALRMQIWTVLSKVTKVFRSNLAKSSDCKLGWQNSSKTASGRLNMKVIGSWKQRSGGRVREGKVLVVKDFRPDCPQKGARRCNFLHKWSRNRENMSLATYISFQTSENIWGNVQNK